MTVPLDSGDTPLKRASPEIEANVINQRRLEASIANGAGSSIGDKLSAGLKGECITCSWDLNKRTTARGKGRRSITRQGKEQSII